MTESYKKRLIELVEELEEKTKHLSGSLLRKNRIIYHDIKYLAGYVQPLKEKQTS